MARGKRKSKPTSSRRAERQEIKERYSKAREDAQLAGLIPTSPEEAIGDRERRNPATEFDPALPDVVRQALKEGWAVPDSAKPHIVAALLEPFFKDEVVFDEDGKAHHVKPSKKLLNELAKTLRTLDQTQFERDHPEEAAKAKGGGHTTNVNVLQQNMDMAAMIKEMVERGQAGLIGEVQAPTKSGSLSYGRQQRTLEGISPPSPDQRPVGEGVDDSEQ